MNNLAIVEYQGHKTIDSRQVAEITGIEHKNLLRDIRGYIEYFTELKSEPSENDNKYVKMAREMFEHTHNNINNVINDFFIESTYQDSTGRNLPCYMLTKKGCDMVANKMTGEKGVLFTAMYVTKFEAMEKQQVSQMSQLEIIAQIARSAADQEKKMLQIEQTQIQQSETLQSMRDVVALSSTSWRGDSSMLISKMARKLGGNEHIQDLRNESYKLLNDRMGVDLKCRLTNKRRRMAEEGICKSKRDNLNT